MSEFQDRIPWERRYYVDIILPHSLFKTIKCRMCGTAFTDDITLIPDHISHLNEHGITELTDHPERALFERRFLINTEESTAECRRCKKKIVYKRYGLYLLKNHIEMYHTKNFENYELIMKTEERHQILDKYLIIDNEAKCLRCDQKIDMTHSKTQPAEKVKELLEHYFSHWYKEKCFIFATRRENRFCFTRFVPIISL